MLSVVDANALIAKFERLASKIILLFKKKKMYSHSYFEVVKTKQKTQTQTVDSINEGS